MKLYAFEIEKTADGFVTTDIQSFDDPITQSELDLSLGKTIPQNSSTDARLACADLRNIVLTGAIDIMADGQKKLFIVIDQNIYQEALLTPVYRDAGSYTYTLNPSGADKRVTEGAEAEVFLDIWERIKAQVDAAYAP